MNQAPFLAAIDHLRAFLPRVRLLVQRHMRRHAERYLQRDGNYTDRAVTPDELQHTLNGHPSPQAQAWLDDLGVAPRDAVEALLEEESLRLERRLVATLERDPAMVLPIEELRTGCHLGPREVDLLLLTACASLYPEILRLFAVAWVDFSVREPTAAFLAELVEGLPEEGAYGNDRGAQGAPLHYEAALHLLSERAPLRLFQLLQVGPHRLHPTATPRAHSPVSVPQRVIDFLSGLDAEQAVPPGCVLHTPRDPQHLILDDALRGRMLAALGRPRPRLWLTGPPGAGRRTVTLALSTGRGRWVLEVDLTTLTRSAHPEHALQRWAEVLREGRLHQAVLLLRADALSEEDVKTALHPNATPLADLLAQYPAPVFITSTGPHPVVSLLCGPLTPFELSHGDNASQRLLWQRALAPHLTPEASADLALTLSRNYSLTPGAIHRVVNSAAAAPGTNAKRRPRLDATQVVHAIRQHLDHRLGWLAEVVQVETRLDDLVLDDLAREKIEEVLIYARQSALVFEQWGFDRRSPTGRGLSMLFSGPPGTGKTLCAGVIAHELGRLLYRIDLSRVVDKYVGETEKNLARVFDEAERAQAVLLFDEADALFAKRTAVRSSNDRYANLEVNYLLQRLDAFDGVAILTTNFITGIDEAFERRIRFKITFPMPERGLRAELWRKLLPPHAPCAPNIDWDTLGADFEFSGGHIRNAVLRAAVHAADRAAPIDHDLLYEAAAAESREMGKLVFDVGDDGGGEESHYMR